MLLMSFTDADHVASSVEQEVTCDLKKTLNAKPKQKPVLLLIGGYQGAGKSSLIARIKEVYDVNVISTDVIRQNLMDKGMGASPEFANSVRAVYLNLLNHSLSCHSHTVIDANAHVKRIQDLDSLLREKQHKYTVVKILLAASEDTLRARVKNREPTTSAYQGTLSDLEASLKSSQINPKDYDLEINTDNIHKDDVYQMVNNFIAPYFSSQ